MFNVLKSVASVALSPDQKQRAAIVPALVSAVQSYPGGVGGLVAAFNQGGLSKVVSSWMSQDTSLPVGESQLQNVLGEPMITQIAQQSGLNNNQVLSHLTGILPVLMQSVAKSGDAKSLDLQSLLAAVMKNDK